MVLTRICSCDRRAFSGLTEVCRAVQFNTGDIAEIINWVTAVVSTSNALEKVVCKAVRSWSLGKHLGYSGIISPSTHRWAKTPRDRFRRCTPPVAPNRGGRDPKFLTVLFDIGIFCLLRETLVI